MNPKDLRRLVRKVNEIEHTFPPACECGCGEPVRMGIKGPQRFVNIGHYRWTITPSDRSEWASKARQAQLEASGGKIEIERFRAFVNGLREKRGWSLADIAQRGGQQPGWLHTYMFDKRYSYIGKDTAEKFIRRIAGDAVESSKWQDREAKEYEKKVHKAILEVGVDADRTEVKPISWVRYGNR